MSRSIANPASELRVPLKSVIIALAVLVIAILFLSEDLSDLSQQFQVQNCGMLLLALLAIAWLLDGWKPWAGRWLLVIGLVAVINLADRWQAARGTLALMAIPTGLAAALVSIPAAAATALGETALLLLLPKYTAAGVDWAATGVALIGTWAMLGLMYAVYHPILQLSERLEEYSEHALCVLEEARERRAELEQALDDLSNANRQLTLTGERIAALRMIAEEAQRTKTVFLAKVSHEFRTPLNMIIGLVSLMVQKAEIGDEDVPLHFVEDLRVVYRNCEYLSSMISDVLDLSRIDAGHLSLYRERVDLAEVIHSALAVVRPLLKKKGLSLQLAIPDERPEVYCDRVRIRQAILNMLSNAARFTSQGEVSLSLVEQDEKVVVRVTDTGPGIAPEDAERIFEPFDQGTAQLWRDKGGSGLGLSISRQFVRLHGGRMWLESELGVGSSFIFELPISPPIGHAVRPGYQIREDWVWREHAFRTDRVGSYDQLLRPRIVICDETGSLLRQFTRYTDEIEFVDIRGVTQATQALRECPAHTVLVNTESTDDLWSLVEEVRQQAPHTPVMGCSVPRQITRALETGAASYLIKPVLSTDLEKVIRALDRPVRRVLVVDDDPEFLKLLARMLHAHDSTLEVVTASSGEQALDALRSRPPDLMLLDIVMPDIDGWQVMERKGKDDEIADIPVIFVSARDPAEQPMASQVLLVTTGGGLSLSQLLRCSLELPELLSKPLPQPGPVPV